MDFSYRFNEAVCSGGIPVDVWNEWIPPFDEIIPFKKYGVQLAESEVDNLQDTIDKVDIPHRNSLRLSALEACRKHFGTMGAIMNSVALYVTRINQQSAAASEGIERQASSV